MFSVGFWEMIIVGVLGLIFCVGPLAAILIALAVSANSRNHGRDERGA
jgi:hypothetical protein